MSDILASGPPDDTGRRRKPPAWLALLVAAGALVGMQAWRERASEPEAGASPAPTATLTPQPSESSRSTGDPARFRLDGRVGVGPAGVRLLVGGARPVVVDAGTGRVAALRGVPQMAAGQTAQLLRLPAATVVVIKDGGYRPVEAVVLPDAGGTFSVGAADGVVPAADGALLAYDSGWMGQPGRLASLTAGGRLRWRRHLAFGTSVLADSPHGLLVESDPDPERGGALQLVDARTGRVRRSLGSAQYILASTPEAVPGCRPAARTVAS